MPLRNDGVRDGILLPRPALFIAAWESKGLLQCYNPVKGLSSLLGFLILRIALFGYGLCSTEQQPSKALTATIL